MQVEVPTSAAATGLADPQDSVRAQRLREVAVRALDESLAGCSPDDFVQGFPSLSTTHQEVLQHVYSQAQRVMRENTAVRGPCWRN